MRYRNVLLAIAFVAPLAACDKGPENLCTIGSVAPPPADTLLGATLNGRSFEVGSGPGNAFFLAGTNVTGPFFEVQTRVERERGEEFIVFVLTGFNGVGTYPLNLQAAPRGGTAGYRCYTYNNNYDLMFSARGVTGDTAWVTSYDSVTGHIEGKFQFFADDGEGGGIQVSGGTFEGTAEHWESE